MLKKLFFAAVLLPAVLLTAGEAPLYLVTPRSPSAMEERAAQELMYFYKAIYGRPLLRIPESESSGRAAIFLGRTDFAVQNRIDAEKFDQEEWLLKTAGNSLIIAGGSSVGILYGVYQLLENLGVAFLAPDETVIPAAPGDFPFFDERGRPAFAGRIIRDGLPAVLRHDTSPVSQWAESGVVESYRLWKLRTRINGGAEKGVPLYWTGRVNDLCHKPECREYARAHVRRFPCDRPEKGDEAFEAKFAGIEADPVLPKRFRQVPARERRCVTASFFRPDASRAVTIAEDSDSVQRLAVKSAHPDPVRHGGGIFCSLAHWFDPLRTAKGNTWNELWFSAKFTGPDYVPGSKAENAVYVDAVAVLRPWEDK